MINLRKEVQALVHRAIDSTVHYDGQEYDLNRHNWEQITTDRILAALMQSLPEPVDIKSKYETENGGIFINIGADESEKHNEQQLDYLAQYKEDLGWNHYYFHFTDYLQKLYTVPEPMVQSEHEPKDITIHGTNSSEDDSDSEPSKVR